MKDSSAFFEIINKHATFILGTPEKTARKKIPSTITSAKEKMSVHKIKITDEYPKDETFEVVQLGKMTNKKGAVTNTPVIHYCIFCPEDAKSQQKITKHWYNCHKNREEVKEILAIASTKAKLKDLCRKEQEKQMLRTKRINSLKHKGDYR